MHWDFAFILIFLATAVPWLGRRRIRQLTAAPQTTKRERLVLYASTCVFQWFAVALILWRLQAHHIALRDLGLAVPNILVVAVTTLILGTLVFANQIFSLRRLGARPGEIQGSISQMALKVFPQDNQERLAFLALVATVAVCEEFIYRGFVQGIFETLSGGSALVAIVGSAAMFSLAHLYQGKRGLISTFVIGSLFSAVRYGTGSLIPTLVAHFIADLMAGFLAPKAILTALESANNSASGVSTTNALDSPELHILCI